ncbi:hypothetical protein H0H93_008829 [Arthromyces matolae]|nr:hypothetical protein H0H93_008829 [Arthromyces matolae]
MDRLRTEVDKGVSRLKDADARSKKLLAMIKERDHELNILRERVDLTRRILAITKRCDEIQSAVTANNDKIKEKMNQLRTEADHAIARAEEAETKNKKYEQLLLEKDQEISSLQHRLGVLDSDLEKAEQNLATHKTASAEGEQSKQTSELLQRKVQLLEEELDTAEKNLKETVENISGDQELILPPVRLRQVDVKAEHFERQVQRAEQERDVWEKKFEVGFCFPTLHQYKLNSFREIIKESEAKYKKSQAELAELEASMQDL